jgi:ankyrin repeat protein
MYALFRAAPLPVLAAASFWLADSARAAEDTSLYTAARKDDLAQVESLLSSGASVNAAASDGSTALLFAVYNSDVDMVKALVAAGAAVDTANRYGMTPLLQASRTGDAPVIEVLLDAGAKVELRHPDGSTALMAAARTGRLDAVALLLGAGADPNAADSFAEETPLMWAAAEGHAEVVDALLKAGADPNRRARVNSLTERKNADFPTGGFTAVMWAARNGFEDVAKRLVAGGADLGIRNGDGLTPMMIAIVNDRFDFAAKLLELGADANDGSLFYAVQMRDATKDWYAHDGSQLRWDHRNTLTALDLIERLLDKGADPNLPFAGQLHWAAMCCDPAENATPFYRAAIAGDVEALKLLIAHGADLAWTPSKSGGKGPADANVGRPAVYMAVTGGRGVAPSGGPGNVRQGPPQFREISDRAPAHAVSLLLQAGADPNAAGPDGMTALHQAAKTGSLEAIRVLVDGGARLDALSKDGLTALDIAEGRHAIGAKKEPAGGVMPGDGRAAPDQVAKLLRNLMEVKHVPIVPHGEAADAK